MNKFELNRWYVGYTYRNVKEKKTVRVIKRTTAVSSSVKKGKPCVIANRKSVASKEYREIARKVIKIVEG